jgi:hypothetical protein
MEHALYTGTDYVMHEYSISVTNPKERPHARPRRKWGNNIKTGLSERRCEKAGWIKVFYYRTVACLCEHVNVSSIKGM